MRAPTLVVALALGACRRGPGSLRADSAVAQPSPPRCEADTDRWWVPAPPTDADAPILPPIESLQLALLPDGSPLGMWVTSTDRVLHLAQSATSTHTYRLGPGESPMLALHGTEAVVAWVREGPLVRSHEVLQGRGLVRRCASPELRDDGLTLHLAVSGSTALVVWDEDRPVSPGVVGGSILGQALSLAPGETGCPPGRALSPLAHDAADPVVVARPEGGFVVFWLAQRDLEASQSNDTATELYGLAVSAAGLPVGEALRLTRGPGHRFGLVARARAGALWLAWRASAESDNESRGDGGTVRALRLGTELQGAPEAVTVTPPGAIPMGGVALTLAGEGAEVWWSDRRGGRFRRALDRQGALASDPLEEPVFSERDAALPTERRGTGVYAALRAGGRGAGVLRLRCPALEGWHAPPELPASGP